MTNAEKKRLLEDSSVVQEIKRHLWIESEKAGRDIGFESAASDWFDKYASAWVKHHNLDKKKSTVKKASTAKKKTVARKRRAKTYVI